jgi:hypothetical protein
MSRYYDQTIQSLTASFVFLTFGCSAKTITIANDDLSGNNKVQFSWYGKDIDGAIPASQAITWETNTGNGIYLRYVNGAPAYRLIVRGD